MIDPQDSDVMREIVAEGTAIGFQRAVADPATWASASAGLRKHATAEAGGWLLGGLKVLLSRAMWVLVAGMAIYMIGGWSALVSFFKAGLQQP